MSKSERGCLLRVALGRSRSRADDKEVVRFCRVAGRGYPRPATRQNRQESVGVTSYVLPQRLMLRDTKVRVFENALPWARTDLINSREAKQAIASGR